VLTILLAKSFKVVYVIPNYSKAQPVPGSLFVSSEIRQDAANTQDAASGPAAVRADPNVDEHGI